MLFGQLERLQPYSMPLWTTWKTVLGQLRCLPSRISTHNTRVSRHRELDTARKTAALRTIPRRISTVLTSLWSLGSLASFYDHLNRIYGR